MENKSQKNNESWLSATASNPLFKLKLSYFLIYAAWYSTSAYMALLPTKIVSYNHIALLYAFIPVVSVLGPIFTGFITDKFGNIKTLLMISVVSLGFVPFGVLWLYQDHQSYQETPLFDNDTDHSVLENMGVFVAERSYTFPLLVVFRLAGFIATDVMTTLLDVCGMNMSKKHNGDFARQKLWGAGSMIVIPFICGMMIDLVSEYLGYIDDTIAFVIGAGLSLASLPLILKLEVTTEKNTNSIMTTAKKVVGMIDFDIFILVEIIIGACYGFHCDFLPVFIHSDLIGSKTMIGLILGINGIGTMVIMSIGKIIIDKIGEAHTVMIGLMLYCLRFMIFYYIQNPWILLATEFFEGSSGFISFVAGSYYCISVSPPGMLASLNGIVYAAVFGLGKGLGTTIGSSLMSTYSIRTTYFCFSATAGGTAVIYFIVYHVYLKKIRMERMMGKNQVETSEVFGIDNPAAEWTAEDEAAKNV